MPREKFFSRTRRDFIARALMDVVKLIFVASVVSGFFVSSPMRLRVLSLVGLAATFAVSVLTFPRKEDRG